MKSIILNFVFVGIAVAIFYVLVSSILLKLHGGIGAIDWSYAIPAALAACVLVLWRKYC